MCTKCGYTTVNTYKAAYEAQKIQNAAMIGNMGATLIGNLINGLCNSSENNISAPTNNNKSIATQDSKTAEETKTIEDPKEREEKVKTLLGEKFFNALSDEVKEEVLKKYSTIKEFSANNNITVTDAEMTRRLSNYARALSNIAKAEFGFAQGDTNATCEIAGVNEALANEDMVKYKEAYNQLASEYIELCDDAKGDGRIGLREYIAKENADAGIDIENISDSELQQKFAAEYITFQALDLDQSGYLEKDEVAGMLNWTAVQDNNGRNITYKDNQSFGEDLANYSTAALQLNETDTKTFIQYIKDGNRSDALKLLKDKTDLTEKQFAGIKNAFKGYSNAAKNFIST